MSLKTDPRILNITVDLFNIIIFFQLCLMRSVHLFVSVLFLQRTLQKQSMTYGGKSTVRDRSSGTSSSVAFTPLQVHKHVGITHLEVVTSFAFKLFSHRVAQFPCCSLAETLTDSCGLVD